MRAVLGWLRGDAKHCSMAAIPSIAEEDARGSTRERETLIREQTRAVNRIKSTLIRFGIRAFKVKLRQASKHLEELRGPEGEPLLLNTMAVCAAIWYGYRSFVDRSERSRKRDWNG
jgi:transposase